MGDPGDLMPVTFDFRFIDDNETVDVPFHTGDGVLPSRMVAGDE